MQAPVVYAIIPAYRRPALLARALASLSDQVPELHGAIVVNNSADAQTARVADAAAIPTTVLTPGCNLGTAGGVAAGLRAFLAAPGSTHAWILDDDAIATPGALAAMLAAMRESGADAAMPLLADAQDRVRWLPLRLAGRARRFLQGAPTSAEFLRVCGDEPLRWSWAIWASLVISRRAIEVVGLPRSELWSQFSDIEYTLRVTERFTGIIAPRAVCRHLPPESVGPTFDAKLYSALQNGSYVALRVPPGRRALRHLPGLNLRYLRHYHWRPHAWWRICTAFFKGAVLGRPERPRDAEEPTRRATPAGDVPRE